MDLAISIFAPYAWLYGTLLAIVAILVTLGVYLGLTYGWNKEGGRARRSSYMMLACYLFIATVLGAIIHLGNVGT